MANNQAGVGGLVGLGVIGYFIVHAMGHGVGSGSTDATIEITTSSPSVCWSGAMGDATHDGCGDQTISIHDENAIFSSNVQNQGASGSVTITLVVGGEQRDSSTTSAAYGFASVVNH